MEKGQGKGTDTLATDMVFTRKEYIEREAICYQLEKQESIDGQPRAIRRARRIVAEFPAADVVPVRHGKWIKVDDGIYYHMECSLCHERPLRNRWVDDNELSPYCPNCGVRMDMITDSNQVKDSDGE